MAIEIVDFPIENGDFPIEKGTIHHFVQPGRPRPVAFHWRAPVPPWMFVCDPNLWDWGAITDYQ